MIARIDHISIAVKNYEKARCFFQDILGAVPGAGADNHDKKFFWQIFSLGDLSRFELIYPTGPGGLLEKFLENNKEGGFHHLTLQTSDIQKIPSKRFGIHNIRNTEYFDLQGFVGLFEYPVFAM